MSPSAQDPIPVGKALNRRFAENLVLLRGRAGLSQEKTAERAGLHVTQVSLLERGLRLPCLGTIVRLGGALGIEPCELLSGMAWRLRDDVRQPGAYVRLGTERPREGS